MVGTTIEDGRGTLDQEYVMECFRNKCRKEKIVTAPPSGLFLDKVYYSESLCLA
jgi:tRNA U38,U39,U40 pseudouridine synthase TruA